LLDEARGQRDEGGAAVTTFGQVVGPRSGRAPGVGVDDRWLGERRGSRRGGSGHRRCGGNRTRRRRRRRRGGGCGGRWSCGVGSAEDAGGERGGLATGGSEDAPGEDRGVGADVPEPGETGHEPGSPGPRPGPAVDQGVEKPGGGARDAGESSLVVPVGGGGTCT
jgi:hypothetical protein